MNRRELMCLGVAATVTPLVPADASNSAFVLSAVGPTGYFFRRLGAGRWQFMEDGVPTHELIDGAWEQL